MSVARVLATVLLTVFSLPLAAGGIPRVAIIIDDLGYRFNAGERTIALPGPVAVAILPGSPRGRYFADAAHRSGKEVLLHLPMQATEPEDTFEATRITLDMSRAAFAATFATAMTAVPHVVGVNNHRGSLLTRHPGHMQWLMEEMLARDGLFFVDSFTTHESVALQIATETGVQAKKRDVFLDSEPSLEAVEREFERLKKIARQRGTAIAIGHPYEATLAMLEARLPQLEAEGFDLVAPSALMAN